MLVYFYDLKPKQKNNYKDNYNRLKRRFYYQFNKIKLKEFSFKTKSVLIVDEKYEKLLDSFFLMFKDESEVYKIKTNDIEQLC